MKAPVIKAVRCAIYTKRKISGVRINIFAIVVHGHRGRQDVP
jgi:hypothetical protein